MRVYFVGRRGKDALVYDEAAVMARFGVAPECLPAYVSLVGDPSDNLPGVPGIGAVSAQKILAGKRSCQELFADLESVKSARLREVLIEHREQILNTETLARLRDDAPIGEHAIGWFVPTPASFDALAQLFEQLEFKSLLARLGALRG